MDWIDNIGQGCYYLIIIDDNGFVKVDSVDILNFNWVILLLVLVVVLEDIFCVGQDVYLFSFSVEMEMLAYEWYDNFGNFIQEGNVLYLFEIVFFRELEVFINVCNCLFVFIVIDVEVLLVLSVVFMLNNNVFFIQDIVIFILEVNDG